MSTLRNGKIHTKVSNAHGITISQAETNASSNSLCHFNSRSLPRCSKQWSTLRNGKIHM